MRRGKWEAVLREPVRVRLQEQSGQHVAVGAAPPQPDSRYQHHCHQDDKGSCLCHSFQSCSVNQPSPGHESTQWLPRGARMYPLATSSSEVGGRVLCLFWKAISKFKRVCTLGSQKYGKCPPKKGRVYPSLPVPCPLPVLSLKKFRDS